MVLRPVEPPILREAGLLARSRLGSLDAIHVATALRLLPLIDAFFTYDSVRVPRRGRWASVSSLRASREKLTPMPSFSAFDSRGYRTVDAREGYDRWAATYEDTVEDAMDIALLDRVEVDWSGVGRAADLGCGTGRTGAWLKARGVGEIDGIDLSPGMLATARARGVYRSLDEGEVGGTGLDGGAYDLVVSCLVDEHLADLGPLYGEAARLLRPGGRFVLVGFHPHFIIASGMPTHFDDAESGESLAIETHVHPLSEHVAAGLGAGLTLAGLHERLVDDEWVSLKPKWERFRDHPISFAFVWAVNAQGQSVRTAAPADTDPL